MPDNDTQDIRDRLIRIEVLLENIHVNQDLKFDTLEEKIKVANHRIDDLESDRTWLWRAVIGTIVSAVIGFIIKT